MSPSLIHDPIRKLPLWQDGFAHGQHVGLRIALETILAEQANQEQTAERRGGTPLAYGHMFAASVLLDVAKVIGARFRQTP
jgi:hypothetical protein